MNIFPFSTGLATLAVAFLLLPFGLAAQTSSGCEQSLKSYIGWKETSDTQWNLTLQAPGGGSLHYLGAFHSTDPSHPQFKQIKTAWTRLKPTLVFYEGPNRGIGASETETIQQLGESGYARYLAGTEGIKTQTLEMSPQEQVQLLLASDRFTLEQIKLFFVLREATRLRDRKNLTEAELKTAISQLLVKANGLIMGFDQVVTDVAALQGAYQKHWSAPANWWEAPAAWFTPGGDGGKTGGQFTHEINRLDSENRNLHMYRLISEAVLRGERVLAVVGRNHVPMQAEALKCALVSRKD